MGLDWNETLGRCSYCGAQLCPKTEASDNENRIACPTCIGDKENLNLAQYRRKIMTDRGYKSFVFFFEILIFSDFGQRLRTMYALERKTNIL